MNILVIVIILIVILVAGLVIFMLYIGLKSKSKTSEISGGDVDIFSDEGMTVLNVAIDELNSQNDKEIDIKTLAKNISNASGGLFGGAPKNQSSKPVIILFPGFAASKLFWEYAYEGKSDLRQLNFLKKLKRIGDIYTFNYPFFNVNHYTRPDLPKESKVWNAINEKYKPYDPELSFTLEDLDYSNICKKIHEDVRVKYGPGRKYILVGHSYGCQLSLLFAKMYASECKLCVCIDNAPYVLKFYEKYNERQNKTLVTKINDNKKLEKLLNTIRTSSNEEERNEAGGKVLNLISRLSALDRIKYYDSKLYVPTLFYKSLKTNPDDMERIRTRFNRKEKKQFSTDKNMKLHKFFKDAEHYIWNNQKYSDAIVRGIKKFSD